MPSLKRLLPTMREAQGEYNGPFSTYPEAHAFIWAVGYMATFVMALQVSDIAAGAVLAQIVRVSYFAMTGKRLEIADKRLGVLPDAYLKQIRDESHYWFGGLFVGFAVAYTADYYGYIPFVERLADLRPTDVFTAGVAAIATRPNRPANMSRDTERG